RPGCCPGTGRPPPSARSSHTCRSGSTAATEAGCQPPHPPYPPGQPPHPPGRPPYPFGRTQRKVRFSTADPYLTLRSALGGGVLGAGSAASGMGAAEVFHNPLTRRMSFRYVGATAPGRAVATTHRELVEWLTGWPSSRERSAS